MPVTAIPAKNVEKTATWIQKKMGIPGVVSILLTEQSLPSNINDSGCENLNSRFCALGLPEKNQKVTGEERKANAFLTLTESMSRTYRIIRWRTSVICWPHFLWKCQRS